MLLHEALAQVKGYKADSFKKWVTVGLGGVLIIGTLTYTLIVHTQLSAILAATREINATLSRSNRAYIIPGTAQLDEFNGTFTLPLRNTGRIPSGQIVVVLHTATINATKPHLFPGINAAIGYAWSRKSFNSFVPGEGRSVSMQLQKFAPKKVAQALQEIVIAAKIFYNDGFPGDQLDRRSFCVQNVYNANAEEISWRDCDADIVLPQIEAVDGYSKSQQSH